MTIKRIGGKLKTIRKNVKKAADTSKSSGGGRIVLTFYGLFEKLWSGSPAVTSIANSIDTSSSTNQNVESTENNDSKNMAPSSYEGTGYVLECGCNFEESNYSDEGTKSRSSYQRCSIKKVFLEISQNSQESTCARVSFSIKFAACLQPY